MTSSGSLFCPCGNLEAGPACANPIKVDPLIHELKTGIACPTALTV